MTVGQRIHDRRLEIGLSVDKLAEKIGKNRATVYRYENNYIENIPLTIIKDLSSALETSPTYLMGTIDFEASATDDNKGASEFIELYNQLSNEQQSLIVAQIKGILLNKK